MLYCRPVYLHDGKALNIEDPCRDEIAERCLNLSDACDKMRKLLWPRNLSLHDADAWNAATSLDCKAPLGMCAPFRKKSLQPGWAYGLYTKKFCSKSRARFQRTVKVKSSLKRLQDLVPALYTSIDTQIAYKPCACQCFQGRTIQVRFGTRLAISSGGL